MSVTYHSGLHRYAVFTVCWTVLLLVAGALVTSNGAGLSVPDWPLSFGTLTPPMVGGIVYEHSHRVIAGGLALLTLVLAVWIWIKDERPWLRWMGVIAVLGVLAQAVLGGEVVIHLLRYWLPVLHACFAQIVFAAVVSIAVFTSRWWISHQPQLEDRGAPSIHGLAILNSTVILLQIILGAAYRHREIPVWPHVVGSFFVMGMIIWTAAVLRKRFENSPAISKVRVLLHAAFGLQFLLGIGAYWSRLVINGSQPPIPVMVTLTVAHTVVGAILFGSSVLAVLLCYRLIPSSREPSAAARPQVAL
ncbi:MAG: COX15/CtaA family protein [Candidatus Acidiferrum sp.]